MRSRMPFLVNTKSVNKLGAESEDQEISFLIKGQGKSSDLWSPDSGGIEANTIKECKEISFLIDCSQNQVIDQ